MAERRIRSLIPTQFRTRSLSGVGKVRNLSERGLFGWPRISLTGLVWWTARHPSDRNAHCGFGLRLVDDNDAYLRLVASLR